LLIQAMKLPSIALALVVALGGLIVPARAQEVTPTRVLELSFQPDGRVNLSARNVTMREILVEWARQCGCYVVNAEKLPGGSLAVPLLFQRESQERVLESLLRQAAGFVLTPQRLGSLSRSDFETIYILASSNAVANSFTPSTPVSAPLPTAGSPDDELPPVSPMMPQGMPPTAVPLPGAPGGAPMPMAPGQQSPIPGTTQQQQQQTPRVPGTPMTFVPIVPIGNTPSTPGAPAPGMVVPITPQGR